MVTPPISVFAPLPSMSYGWQMLFSIKVLESHLLWLCLPKYEDVILKGPLPGSQYIRPVDHAHCSWAVPFTFCRRGGLDRLIFRPCLPIKKDGSIYEVPNSIAVNCKNKTP